MYTSQILNYSTKNTPRHSWRNQQFRNFGERKSSKNLWWSFSYMANYSYNVCGNLLLLIFNVSRTWLGVEDKSLWKLWRNLKKNFKFPDYIQKKWRNLWDSLYLLFSCEITGAAIRTVSGQILKKQLITLFLHSWKLLNKLLELDLEIIASVHSLSGLQDSFRIERIGIFPWFFVQGYSKELFRRFYSNFV